MRVSGLSWCLLGLGVWILGLAGCVKPSIPANIIHDGVHNGGSALAFNQQESRLASGGWEGRLHLWSLPDGVRIRSWQAHTGTINGLAYIHEDTILVSAGYDKRIVFWDRYGQARAVFRVASPITGMAVDLNRGLLATGHDDGHVTVWQITAKPWLERIAQQRLHKDRVRGLAWHPQHLELAASSKDGRVMRWRIHSEALELPSPSSYARSLVYTQDGRTLIGSGWFRLFHWELEQGQLREIPTEHRGIINSIEMGGADRYLASISRQTDSSVYFLDPRTGEVVERFQPHDLCGGFVALSPEGGYMATTGDDASVRIWDLDQRLSKEVINIAP